MLGASTVLPRGDRCWAPPARLVVAISASGLWALLASSIGTGTVTWEWFPHSPQLPNPYILLKVVRPFAMAFAVNIICLFLMIGQFAQDLGHLALGASVLDAETGFEGFFGGRTRNIIILCKGKTPTREAIIAKMS